MIPELKEVPQRSTPKDMRQLLMSFQGSTKRSTSAGHIIWARLIGVSPKACRDTVATTLRDADVNERVIGAILGHSPSSSTNLYGSVSMDAKLRALENIMNDMTKGCETQSNKEVFQDPVGMED